jgi:hypothetical protein
MPSFAFWTQGAGVQMIKRRFGGFLNIDPANTARADPILVDQYHCQARGEARSRHCAGLDSVGKQNLRLVGKVTTSAREHALTRWLVP